MDREKQLTNYFTVEKPVFKVKGLIYFLITWVVVIAILLLIIKAGMLFKLALFAGLLVWAYFKYFNPYFKQMALYNSRLADKEVDAIFEKDLNDQIALIIKKEGIDEEDEDELKAPTFISCWPANGFNRIGFDGRERWAVSAIQMLFFKEDSVLFYDGQYGHVSESRMNEETQRVFYKDIISPKIMRDGDQEMVEFTGTQIKIHHYPGYFPIHGKNRTSDVNFMVKALEKLMHSTKYKTVS